MSEGMVLSSPDDEGSLDYLTSVITLFKYSADDRALLRKAVTPKPNSKIVDFKSIEAYKLLVHEYTHYLDLTTTVWGAEYLNRRNSALDRVLSDGPEAISVAMLNTAEILIHKELVKVHKPVKFIEVKTKYELVYSERHGVVVIIYVYVGDELVAQTPLSMLSLLEANAVAHEMMAEVKWVSIVLGGLDTYQEQRINSRFDEVIKDPERLEYNILHVLIRIHFPGLNFISRLKLAVAIFDFSLNASSIAMSAIANVIIRMFNESDRADAICNDLCRGMSRHLIAFKTILLLYRYVEDSGLDLNSVAGMVDVDPLKLIVSVFAYFDLDLPGYGEFSISDFEYCTYIGFLRAKRSRFEFVGHIGSMLRNRRVRKLTPFVVDNIRRLKLPDVILDDLTTFRMPGGLRYDVYAHCDRNYEECLGIRKLIKDKDLMKKFHMKPGEWGPMQELRHRAILQYFNG